MKKLAFTMVLSLQLLLFCKNDFKTKETNFNLKCIKSNDLKSIVEQFINLESNCINRLSRDEAIYLLMGSSGADTLVQIEVVFLHEAISHGTASQANILGQRVLLHPSIDISLFFDDCEDKKIGKKMAFNPNKYRFAYMESDTLTILGTTSKPHYAQWNYWYSRKESFTGANKFHCDYERSQKFLDSLEMEGWSYP